MTTAVSEFTFKHNVGKGRHGWIRLTPAYSIVLVEEILKSLPDSEKRYVLDPFSGSGTTGLVSAQNGIPCDLYETNPFLEWLAKAKTQFYNSNKIEAANKAVSSIVKDARNYPSDKLWVPDMFKIERWWDSSVLDVLKRVHYGIVLSSEIEDEQTIDLLKIGFCNLLIKWSNAAFNHQSMSFKKEQINVFSKEKIQEEMLSFFELAVHRILRDAYENPKDKVTVYLHNSKKMPDFIKNRYSCVITSPPYANRMSYVREVRPYMYWLNLIRYSKQAADIEWDSIGGTWGTATSRLQSWKPLGVFKEDKDFLQMTAKIEKESKLLANYVHRYFEDMNSHFSSLPSVLKHDAQIHYIIGNSKFYEIVVPTEEIYAKILKKNKFKSIKIAKLRKRSSKKELYEYHVSALWENT